MSEMLIDSIQPKVLPGFYITSRTRCDGMEFIKRSIACIHLEYVNLVCIC